MAPSKAKGGRMLALINHRLRVTLSDSRSLTGQMLAFDKHMNLVLADCEEFRRVRRKVKKPAATAPTGAKEEDSDDEAPKIVETELKRTLGLVILRGEVIVSISVEGPPPANVDDKGRDQLPPGMGRGMPAGRGMGLVPPGAGPTSLQARPMPYARPPPGFPGAPPGGAPPGFPPPGFPGQAPPGFPGAPPPGMFRPPPPGFAGAPPQGFPGAPPQGGAPPGFPGGQPGFRPGFPPPRPQ